jgi:PhzF family phenazine biosynthesis protein
MHRIPLTLVDAFTHTPFAGNSAAVCLLPEAAVAPDETAWMQTVAREMNQPATVFVRRHEGGFALRWFTAEAELQLCGHGTLATAHVLWDGGLLHPDETADFETRGGALRATRDGDWITLDFPAQPAHPVDVPPDLIEALGVEPRAVARSDLDYLVELASEAEVRAVRPDVERLRGMETRGVIVTAPASLPGFDVVSRFFAPRFGLDEDAATGSAHCALGPYWSERLGRRTLLAYQASVRGGVVRVAVEGTRVRLGGQAVTVLTGSLNNPAIC